MGGEREQIEEAAIISSTSQNKQTSEILEHPLNILNLIHGYLFVSLTLN